jgi:hypothetical protein
MFAQLNEGFRVLETSSKESGSMDIHTMRIVLIYYKE